MAHNTKKVKKFWEDQAKTYKESQLATAPDSYYRDLEITSIARYLRDNSSILDVGCGNGYSILAFARQFPRACFSGVDYSESMIRFAKTATQKQKMSVRKRVSFDVANALSLSSAPALKKKKFDYIVSERCLINLANWREQKEALLEMRRLLKKGGRIILAENTQEGLARLNELRKQFGLHAIAVRWHNYYMPEKKLLSFAKKHFKIESIENCGNLYYILSRVVYAKLADMEGVPPDYLHPINKIASKLPSLGNYQYSPNFIHVLRAT